MDAKARLFLLIVLAYMIFTAWAIYQFFPFAWFG